MTGLAVGLICVAVIIVVLGVLDLVQKVPLINPVVMALYLPIAMNVPLLAYLIFTELGVAWLSAMIITGLALLYVWIHLNVFPIMDGVPVGFRLKALGGASPILFSLGYAIVVEAVLLPLSFVFLADRVPTELLIGNLAYALGCCLVLYLNGSLRAILLSKSLGVLSRWLIATAVWVPVIGWLIGIGAARGVRQEYRAAVDRVEWERAVPQDDRCATRYPILLVHGVGWRDRVRFNAWGRIPKYLKRHGANLFYGEQEAWGTIAQNGEQVARRIREVTELTGAPKINIIAHSRGGIDSRYAITTLGEGCRVASLTTMNTPHHGVRFADTATKLKQPVYRRLAGAVNWVFGLAGDEAPDFLDSTMAFRTEVSAAFNRETPDHPAVYYQSYTSIMTRPSSDRVLSVPFQVIKALGEENDGLVSVDSAKWGEFRGVLCSTTRRGVSHGDLVDMHREDYAGFNVLDAYIKIVADLKQRGF
ncbi:esterase/lipase family protein [Microlunatus parietis]|uniref:Triacylglycerol lipase n=1 Tax=Microlunatus parietis TaxID=682979 RepID=A0A7Y9I680_9ACTN|nr:triacylglycerol lipase [Microlunatus parietis]NYE70489.1 triacylglycerol lipase [Microlunatus parietis]